MATDDTVSRKLMGQLMRSWESEARGIQGGPANSAIERRMRDLQARVFRACAERLKQTLQTRKVPGGLY